MGWVACWASACFELECLTSRWYLGVQKDDFLPLVGADKFSISCYALCFFIFSTALGIGL